MQKALSLLLVLQYYVEYFKCAVLTIRWGKSKPTDILQKTQWFDEEHGYWYLGIYDGADFLTEHVKKAILKEYLSWVCSILRAQLTADSTMTAIYAYDVPMMRYPFGIIRWVKT
eukprot:5070916-Ditylum_brightwellii.AAC.1